MMPTAFARTSTSLAKDIALSIDPLAGLLVPESKVKLQPELEGIVRNRDAQSTVLLRRVECAECPSAIRDIRDIPVVRDNLQRNANVIKHVLNSSAQETGPARANSILPAISYPPSPTDPHALQPHPC